MLVTNHSRPASELRVWSAASSSRWKSLSTCPFPPLAERRVMHRHNKVHEDHDMRTRWEVV